MKASPKIMFLAGETSSSVHLSRVIHHLKTILPNAIMLGTGGDDMKKEGVYLYYTMKDLEVMGLFNILPRLFSLIKIFNHLLEVVETEKPDIIVLADYPGFNLRFIKKLKKVKKLNIPIVYYIPPIKSIFTGKRKIRTLHKYVDYNIPLFAKEDALLKKYHCKSHFFGNPLVDGMHISLTKQEFITKYNLPENKRIVSLFPGSRHSELVHSIPFLLKTVAKLTAKYDDLTFIMPISASNTPFVKSKLSHYPIQIITDDTYNAINASYVALNMSGTLTLELMLLNCISVTFYAASFLENLFFRFVVFLAHIKKIKPFISLTNILNDSLIVPEVLPYKVTPATLYKLIALYLDHPSEFPIIKKQFTTIKPLLGSEGAYQNTAKFIAKLIQI